MLPIYTLGERVRKLRKQQQLTLEALAGTNLTKGMLSLIENNKANPSMESLNYIAKRLGVEVSELLEEVTTEELRELLEKVEKLYNTEYGELTDEYEQIISLVGPFVSKLTHSYEAARLLEIYSISMYRENHSEWQILFNRAAQMYERMNLTMRRVSMGIFLSMRKFVQHEYSESLEILLSERAKIESNTAFIDPMSRIDFDYHESMLYFAVGDYTSAVKVMKEAIDFSKESRVFYNIDHLYRLASFHAMMERDEKKTAYYLGKLRQYSIFADDKEAHFFAEFAEVHYLNSYRNQYEKALLLVDLHLNNIGTNSVYKPFLYLEKGKSLFGLRQFEEALHFLSQAIPAEFLHHPLDLSMFYEGDAYAALCQMELGIPKKALEYIEPVMDQISTLADNPYTIFIKEAHEKIRERQ